MVAQSPPYALQNAQHSAALFRQAAHSPFASAGVLSAGELAVTAQATPNMSVQVAAGRAWMKGTQVSNVAGGTFTPQAAYFGLNDAPVSLTIAAADPTNPRIDLVVAYVQDSFYSGSTNSFALAVITGTPAASPTAPTAPSNALVLATVAVAANATSIVSGNIAATPTASLLAVVRGGQTVCTSTTRPGSPADGQPIYETDTKAFGFFEAGSGKWVMYDTVWQTYTPTFESGVMMVALGNGILTGKYFRKGREVTADYYFQIGSSGTNIGAGTIRIGYPAGYQPAALLGGAPFLYMGTARVIGDAGGTGVLVTPDPGGSPARRFIMITTGDGIIAAGSGPNSVHLSGHSVAGQITYSTDFGA